MANALNRRIIEGEVVIISKQDILEDYWDDRRFRCDTGFGLSPVTSGSAIGGVWLADNEHDRMSGFDIDPRETEYYQKTGKFGRDIDKEFTDGIKEV